VQEGDRAITESAASEQIDHRAPVQEATSATLDVDHGNFLLNNADLVNGLHERVYVPLQIVSANIEHSGASQCFDSSKRMGNSSGFHSGDWNMSHDRQRLASYFGMRVSYYAWKKMFDHVQIREHLRLTSIQRLQCIREPTGRSSPCKLPTPHYKRALQFMTRYLPDCWTTTMSRILSTCKFKCSGWS